jgi:hypothetical protein
MSRDRRLVPKLILRVRFPSPALSAPAAGDLHDAIVDDVGELAKAAGIDLAG